MQRDLQAMVVPTPFQPVVVNESNHRSSDDALSEFTNPQQEEFVRALSRTIDSFVTRMHSDNNRNRHIAYDRTVQTLFETLHKMHPQLLQYMQSMEQRRGKLALPPHTHTYTLIAVDMDALMILFLLMTRIDWL